MIDNQLVGYWSRSINDPFVQEIIKIDRFGRFISKIPDNDKDHIIGGWQCLWIKKNHGKNKYLVDTKPLFDKSWEVSMKVNGNILSILRNSTSEFVYNRITKARVPKRYLDLEKVILGRMKLLEER